MTDPHRSRWFRTLREDDFAEAPVMPTQDGDITGELAATIVTLVRTTGRYPMEQAST
ncbi:hypothetical protein [Kitasatospora sp. NPDC047058]|uniref:hypothetical protein n=1 Tax=Kitasatospora sp. NPDC047058 TaxID=3155620 RepID=UPI0033C39D58